MIQHRQGLSVTAIAAAFLALTQSGCDDDSNGNAQTRVTGSCSAGTFVISINADGTVNCGEAAAGAGDITAVTTNGGLTGGATSGTVALSIDPAVIQRRITGVCGAGTFAVSVNADGTTTCAPGGDITSVIAGNGLTGGGTLGDLSLSLAAGGIETSNLANGAVTMAKLALPAGNGIAMMQNGFTVVYPATYAASETEGQCMVSASANTLGSPALPAFQVRPIVVNAADETFVISDWGYSHEILSTADGGISGREATSTAVLTVTGAGPWRFGCEIQGNQNSMRCRVSYLCS